MNKRVQVFKYVIADFLSAMIAWFLFFCYRKLTVNPAILQNPDLIFGDRNLYVGLTVIPLFWLILYVLIGTYRQIYRKSRMKELGQTLLITVIGVTILFFTLILDDVIITNRTYLRFFFSLLFLHLFFTALFRFIITTNTANKIHAKIIGFNTILVGSNGNAIAIYHEIENQEKSSGNKFVGFVNVKGYT
ncbi:MAG: hypothetical protein JW731_17445, partial [Bacteroidales bacterium]|nr:hypothetical protein [Bacteroidales bacterium]